MNAWAGLVIGVLACSTAVIFIKASHTPPLWLVVERLLLAAAVIAPLALRDLRNGRRGDLPPVRHLFWPAAFLAGHFATWVVAARMIPAANSTLIANFTPLVMPVVAVVLLRERVSQRELVATAIGVAGVAGLAVGDLDGSAGFLIGDALCVVSMVALTVYLALARRLLRGSLWLYLAPLFAGAGLLCIVPALLIEGLPPVPAAHEALLVAGLALIPTVIGHSLMNRSMRELRPQVVSLAGLGNVPSAALMAWLLWRESPSRAFWFALAAYIAALAILLQRRSAPVIACEDAT